MRLKKVLFPILLLALCAAAYGPVRRSGFIQDDHGVVQRNPVVQRGNLQEIFSTDYWAGMQGSDRNLYRPITILSFALERGREGRVDPLHAHVVNVLLHALCAWMLFCVGRRAEVSRGAAAAAAVLFAVHPVHTAAVAGLVGRAEILALMFTLAAIVLHLRACPLGENRPLKGRSAMAAAWAAGLMVFLALGSKETGAAAPVLILWIEAVRLRKRPGSFLAQARGRLSFLVPSLAAFVSYLALRSSALGQLVSTQQVPVSENPLSALGFPERLPTSFALLARYGRLLIFPHPLSADYSGNVIPLEKSFFAPLPLVGLGILILLAILLLRPLPGRRTGRAGEATPRSLPVAASLGSAMFLLPYAVVGNIAVMIGVLMAERLLYVPSAGFCLLAAIGGERLLQPLPGSRTRRTAAIGLTSILAAAGAWKTCTEAGNWKNEATLFSAVLKVAPNSPRALFTLGAIHRGKGENEKAMEMFRRAVEAWPMFSAAWFEQGRILAKQGRLQEASAAFSKAVEINPYNPDYKLNYAMALSRSGRLQAAEASLQEILAGPAFPGKGAAAMELGDVRMGLGNSRGAVEAYVLAAQLGRKDVAGRLRRARRAAGLPEGRQIEAP